MKFALAYYLLLIYLTVILKPLIPVVTDGFEHFFSEAWHIETVHARYGNDHLEKQLANETKDDDKANTASRFQESIPFHIAQPEMRLEHLVPIIQNKFPRLTIRRLPHVFILKDAPPPRV
ncbi:MAG: hypothetical protein QM640_02060 [Niabella sp.]